MNNTERERVSAWSSSRCAQEMCGNWSGDGRVCPCALMDLEGDERPIVEEDGYV